MKKFFVLSLALSGWLSFRNFGMPAIMIMVTFLGNKHAKLLQTNLCGFTVIGSAPKFSKRTILTGPNLFFVGISDFSHLRLNQGR